MKRLRSLILGPPRDPLDPEISQRILLAAMLAWVGFGANGLSSALYGPEKAYVALGTHTELGPLLALATTATVFVIALAYSQVMEIFPSGGGSYKIASRLLAPKFGLVSGSAQVVEYVLTIAVSLASGTDALFSLLPVSAQIYKLAAEIALAVLLVVLNLRGMQESIRFLAPIVVGFFFLHALLIVFVIGSEKGRFVGMWDNANAGIRSLSVQSGWTFVAAIFLRAYALGGSTYSGVESMSNHVNLLAEPRLKTGRMAMLYVAFSLAFTAGGIVLLYSLESVQPVHGQTLNAIAFSAIIGKLGLDNATSQGLLVLTLALEGAILLVAANSILIFAPSLLGNMASDSWLPHRFRNLSSRLVREDGVIFIGACCVAILLWTSGDGRLVGGVWRLPVVAGCVVVRGQYDWVDRQRQKLDQLFELPKEELAVAKSAPPDPMQATAIFLTTDHWGPTIHTLLWVQRLFPGRFRNMVFVSAVQVEASAITAPETVPRRKARIERSLDQSEAFCAREGFRTARFVAYGIDPVESLEGLIKQVSARFPDSVCFSNKLILPADRWFSEWLHNQTALSLQRQLHFAGIPLVIFPIKLI